MSAVSGTWSWLRRWSRALADRATRCLGGRASNGTVVVGQRGGTTIVVVTAREPDVPAPSASVDTSDAERLVADQMQAHSDERFESLEWARGIASLAALGAEVDAGLARVDQRGTFAVGLVLTSSNGAGCEGSPAGAVELHSPA